MSLSPSTFRPGIQMETSIRGLSRGFRISISPIVRIRLSSYHYSRPATTTIHTSNTLRSPPILHQVSAYAGQRVHFTTSPEPTPSKDPNLSTNPYSTPKIYTPSDLQALLLTDETSTYGKRSIIIDVREPAELLSTGRIPTAKSLPIVTNPDAFALDDESFEARFGWPKPQSRANNPEHGIDEVIFYCKAGVRSRTAARLAESWGNLQIGDMAGGWIMWAKENGRVERVDEDDLPTMNRS